MQLNEALGTATSRSASFSAWRLGRNARDYIAAEAGFSRLDQSAPVDAGLLWAEFEERVAALHGVVVNAVLRTVELRSAA